MFRASKTLKLVHADHRGPITPTSAGNKYFLLLVDDYSRWMWVLIATHRGGEFSSKEFVKFFEDEGIDRLLSAPYTPKQNVVVERRNCTVMATIHVKMYCTCEDCSCRSTPKEA